MRMTLNIESARHITLDADYSLEMFGKPEVCGLLLIFPSTDYMCKDHILKELVERAREAVQPYRDPQVGLPHPSWILQLPDDVYTGSNLFAFQKSFDGPFQFDVLYESASAKQKLSCTFAPELKVARD